MEGTNCPRTWFGYEPCDQCTEGQAAGWSPEDYDGWQDAAATED